MRNHNNMEHFAYETKKEYIIRLAKEDPFLKIEEIAEIAQTTQRYVRTILSEANLSLMNLREEYARKMEKYSELKILFSIKDSVIGLCLDTESNAPAFTYGKPQRQLLESSGDYVWNKDKVQLNQYMQQVFYYNIPVAVLAIVTATELENADMKYGLSIFSLLGLKQEDTRLTSPEIEIGSLGNLLIGYTSNLDFASDVSVIKISTLINVKNKVFGEEVFFFPSDSIKLTIPGIFNPTLQLDEG